MEGHVVVSGGARLDRAQLGDLDLVIRDLASGTAPPGQLGPLLLAQERRSLADTATSLLVAISKASDANQILVPAKSLPSPMDYAGIYLTLREYLPDRPIFANSDDAFANLFGRQLIALVGREEMAAQLCQLGAIATHPDLVSELTTRLESVLLPAPRARFAAATTGSPPHAVLARQPMLLALARALLDDGGVPAPDLLSNLPLPLAAALLCHCVADSLHWGPAQVGEAKIGGFPERLAVDLVCNQTLNNADDAIGVLDRTRRLWRDFGKFGAPKIGGRDPAALLREITSLEVEDFIALGFALYANRMAWRPERPPGLADDFVCDMDGEKKAAFLRLTARTTEAMTQALRDTPPRSSWDLLAFKTAPVLHYPGAPGELGGLIVIDLDFLLERVTSGLFYIVNDAVKEADGDLARQQWTQAWGSMVEAMVEENLRPHAGRLLGEGKTYFTEADLQAAYPRHKTSDLVLDLGDALVAIEIVSGRQSSATVFSGDPDALRSDLERLVFKKVKQLDDTATCLLDGPDALGLPAGSRPVQPIVVAAGGFAMSPVTANAINDYCLAEGKLRRSEIRPLAVVTIDETEMLEGLLETRSISLAEVIFAWKMSPLAAVSLRNYLLKRFGSDTAIFRPARMRPHFDGFVEDVTARLRLRL